MDEQWKEGATVSNSDTWRSQIGSRTVHYLHVIYGRFTYLTYAGQEGPRSSRTQSQNTCIAPPRRESTRGITLLPSSNPVLLFDPFLLPRRLRIGV